MALSQLSRIDANKMRRTRSEASRAGNIITRDIMLESVLLSVYRAIRIELCESKRGAGLAISFPSALAGSLHLASAFFVVFPDVPCFLLDYARLLLFFCHFRLVGMPAPLNACCAFYMAGLASCETDTTWIRRHDDGVNFTKVHLAKSKLRFWVIVVFKNCVV